MMFLGLRKLGNICCGHKMFLNQIRNIFWVPDAKFVSAANVARAGKHLCRQHCVRNNVSSFARAFMWTVPFDPVNLHGCWSREWKRSFWLFNLLNVTLQSEFLQPIWQLQCVKCILTLFIVKFLLFWSLVLGPLYQEFIFGICANYFLPVLLSWEQRHWNHGKCRNMMMYNNWRIFVNFYVSGFLSNETPHLVFLEARSCKIAF